jgi:glycosyltransferase involved in cell wall biosynthesis
MRILSFGYDTNLLLPEDAGNESQYRQRRYCELLDLEKTFVILGVNLSDQERSLADGRIRVVSVSARAKWQQIGLAYRCGVRVGQHFQPDVVEYQDPQLAGLAAYMVSKRLHAPLVGGVLNDLLDNPTWLGGETHRYFYNWIGKLVLSRSIRVRCDSAETAHSLNRKGYAQVRCVPFFVPWLEQFQVSDDELRDRLTRWQHDPVVLCVTRLSEEKNLPLLLRAFGQAYAAGRRGRLVVVGSGPLKGRLEQLAAELGIGPRVTWAGFVDFPALLKHFHAANVFALSSDAEASARVLIQAQAARLPTITTATSGSRDIVSDGKTGRVTPVGDVSAFARALDDLLNNEAGYRCMLEAGEYHAAEQHGEHVIIKELHAFYECLPPAVGKH